MIGIVGRDGEGFRYFPPRASSVVNGALRVIPFPTRRLAVRTSVFNALISVVVGASRIDERHGHGAPLRGWIYLIALAVLLVEGVLRLRFAARRRSIRVTLPLDLRPVPAWLLLEHVQFFCALIAATLAAIERDHPRHGAPWEWLLWACMALMLLPWLNRLWLRRQSMH